MDRRRSFVAFELNPSRALRLLSRCLPTGSQQPGSSSSGAPPRRPSDANARVASGHAEGGVGARPSTGYPATSCLVPWPTRHPRLASRKGQEPPIFYAKLLLSPDLPGRCLTSFGPPAADERRRTVRRRRACGLASRFAGQCPSRVEPTTSGRRGARVRVRRGDVTWATRVRHEPRCHTAAKVGVEAGSCARHVRQ